MQIILERPVTWLQSDRDGSRNRLMFDTLGAAARQHAESIIEIDTHYGQDFTPRKAPENSVLFSYHSVGNEPNVWRIKETAIPYFYQIDRRGYSGWSELAVEQQKHLEELGKIPTGEAEAFRVHISSWLQDENISKYAQSNLAAPTRSSFVFFPMQVRSDAVAVHNRLDPLKVLRAAARTARRQRKILVVKRHPYCTSKAIGIHLRVLARTNPYVLVSDASVNSLLRACDAVIVGNSGVGLEALVHGKPVFSFSASEYQAACFPLWCLSDLENSAFGASPPLHPMASQFVSYFLKQRCFDARNVEDATLKIGTILEGVSR